MRKRFAGVVFLCVWAGLAVPLGAQNPEAGCTLQKGTYRCDWQAFRARFADAHTVSIEAQPLDRATETQLQHLVQKLGKSLAADSGSGDVIFRVAPANPSGVAIGPADQPLASLQVFARGAEGGRGSLLWVETYSGQADRPYGMVVTSLADQFEQRFHPHTR